MYEKTAGREPSSHENYSYSLDDSASLLYDVTRDLRKETDQLRT